MTTCKITFWGVHCNIIDNNCVNTALSYKNNVHFEGDKIPCKGSYDNQNYILFVISYEIYEKHQRLVLLIFNEMPSSMYTTVKSVEKFYLSNTNS